MSVEKTYICNMCGDRYDNRADVPDLIHGVYYVGNKPEIRGAWNCERHICHACLNGLAKEAAQIAKEVVKS